MCRDLEGVKRWRANKEEEYEKRSIAMAGQEKEAQAQIDALQQKLQRLHEEKERLLRDQKQLEPEELNKTRTAVLDGLNAAKALLAERDVIFKRVLVERDSRIKTLLAAPDISDKVQDYMKFLDMETSLSSLPASYRSAIMAHHGQIRIQLEPIFQQTNAPLEQAKVTPHGISVVAFVDPPDGKPDALALLLPVAFEVYTNWADGEESLQHKFLYRINAALAGMLQKVGVPNAPIMEEEYDGFLLITVYLGNADVVGDVKNALVNEFNQLRRCSAELDVVQLTVDAVWLPPDVIAPEEGE